MVKVRVRGHLRRNIQRARTGNRRYVRVRGHLMRVRRHR
jgi:hypothetical protein